MLEHSFWQWFAEEGYQQVIPLLTPRSKGSPIPQKFLDIMSDELSVPEDQLLTLHHSPDESIFARRSRLILSEFANINFELRPLTTLKGILIAWQGERTFCLPENNRPEENTDTCLHMLAHIALGHINERILTIRLEGETGEFKQVSQEELEADTWAQELKQNHRVLPKNSLN